MFEVEVANFIMSSWNDLFVIKHSARIEKDSQNDLLLGNTVLKMIRLRIIFLPFIFLSSE